VTDWQKWLFGIPLILAINLGLTALAAGRLWWFHGSWSDAAFMLVLTAIWLVGLLLYPAAHGLRWQGTLTRRLLGVGFLLAIGLSVYERTHGPAADRPAVWSIAGLALFALACVLGGMAARTLGKSYSPDLDIRVGQALVTAGIYRCIRHPLYTALLLVVLGMPLIVRSLWGVCGGALVIGPALWLRIREEESRLLDAFGDVYRDYQGHTWRLIPFIF
jgi:protein-S-isoprenylcysteine O-methyltransferase Ste14